MVDPEPRRRGRASAAGSAASKTVRVLEAAAAPDGPHRLADVAARAAVPKPSAHRLLVMLVADGYLCADGSGRYGVGPRLRAFAAQVAAESPEGIVEILRDLQEAAGRQTVHLALHTGDRATYIHKVDAAQPYQMASRVGMSIPLHCTAIGKCILAHLPSAEIEGIIAAGLPARTPATITDRRYLEAELASVRGRQFAVDDEENEATIRCVAAPVFSADGRPLGGISVSTVTFAVSRQELESFVPHLLAAADKVTRALS